MATTARAAVTARAMHHGGWRRVLALALLLGLLGGLLPPAPPPVARAADGEVITVTGTADIAASTIGTDGTCTLREALLRANTPAAPGTDCPAASGGAAGTTTVAFALPAPGPWTITLAGQLPTVTVGLTLDGPGADRLTIRRDTALTPTAFRLLDFEAGTAAVTIRGVTLTGGDAERFDGGGLRSGGSGPLTIDASTFSGNTADEGGGFSASSTATVTGSTFSDNRAGSHGGGFRTESGTTVSDSTFSGNSATNGGGFFADGVVTVTDSTLRDNTARSFGGGFRAYTTVIVSGSTLSSNSAATVGGGFWTAGAATVVNSTFSGNSADFSGGFEAHGTTTVVNSTFSDNRAEAREGGFLSLSAATVTNTLFVAGSNGVNCTAYGGVTDGGGNVSSDNTCVSGGTTSLENTPSLLGALQDNGGPTQTRAPLPGSPARGLGVPSACAAAPVAGVDQRGAARPIDGPCDSGAYQIPIVALAPANLPGGTVGAAYAQQLTASGGVAPYTYAVVAGALPVGLALNPQTGALGGTPTAAGDATFTVTTTDAGGDTGTRAYTLVVAPAPAVVTASVVGDGTVSPPGATGYPVGTVAVYAATPAPGQIFLGWTLDGRSVGFASPLNFTVAADRALVARFAARPAFADVAPDDPAADAIAQLAARGILRGYGPDACAARALPHPCAGPADPLLRAQLAALLVRAFAWDPQAPAGPAPFADLDSLDPELARAVALLTARGVARGYPDGTFDPTGPVRHAQAISLIARAMVAAGHWTVADDDPALYPDVPAASGHRHDLATFVTHAGAIPDRPANQAWGDWDTPASRAWAAQLLWQALASHFGVDRVP